MFLNYGCFYASDRPLVKPILTLSVIFSENSSAD